MIEQIKTACTGEIIARGQGLASEQRRQSRPRQVSDQSENPKSAKDQDTLPADRSAQRGRIRKTRCKRSEQPFRLVGTRKPSSLKGGYLRQSRGYERDKCPALSRFLTATGSRVKRI